MFKKLFDKEKRIQRNKEYAESVYKYWGPISNKGLFNYAFKYATYGWALPVLAIYSIIMYIMSKFNDIFVFGLAQFVFSAIIFMVFGFLNGVMAFRKNERIYRARYPYKSKKKKRKKNI